VGIGNPHAVVFTEDVAAAAVAEIGPEIENDPLFPNRTNVEFVEVVADHTIRVRVWERGVGETRASGTGATAAAFVAHDRGRVEAPVVVELAGGSLEVQLEDEGAWMIGPATLVYRGEL